MPWLVLALIPLAFALALPLSAIVRALGHRVGALDTPPIPGQVKAAPRRVPNTGGVAIVLAIALPLLSALALARLAAADTSGLGALAPHLPGIARETPAALVLIGGILLLHVLGLIDDRRPLGPFLKLSILAVPAILVPLLTGSRLLTLLDIPAGGPWLSFILTALWFLVVTNAFNFLDNMDGLSAGVAAVAGACLLAVALLAGQWFVAATLALLIGALLGFLVLNSPPASLFMGDGGSLVVGFLLAFLTVRATYIHPPAALPSPAASGSSWYGALVPLVLLAVPLYDFITVVLIRLRAHRSPFVGDLNHLSHRLVRLGLSRPAAVAVIVGATAVTALGAVFLNRATPAHAALIGAQTVLMLAVLALFEFAPRPSAIGGATAPGPGAVPASPAHPRETPRS